MEEFRFDRWLLTVDPSATRRAYASISSGSPERCGCLECQNFASAREDIYTAAFRSILDALGIDCTKESEIYHTHKIRPGLHSYGGWFHFVGDILEGRDAWKATGPSCWTSDLVALNDQASLGFTAKQELVSPSFHGLHLVQLEFQVSVPWKIDAAEPQ